MLIIPWIEKIPIAMIASLDHETVVSASSPFIFKTFLHEKIEELRKEKKILNYILMIMFKGSSYALFIKDENDIPENTLHDPGTGKIWVKYEVDQKTKAMIRME